MTYKVNVDLNLNTVWGAYKKSYEAFKHPLGHKAGKSFWDAYKAENNVELVDGYLVFKSEAHYTWFLLRWA